MNTEIVLGGIVISIVSGAIGSMFGSKGKVPEKTCVERRDNCTAQVSLKLDHIKEAVDDIKKQMCSDG